MCKTATMRRPSLPQLYVIIYVTVYVTLHCLGSTRSASACTFPDYLQWREGDEQFNWHTRIRNGRRREQAYSIRHNVIDVSPHASQSALRPSVRWKCALTYHGKFLLKRRDPDTLLHHSACVKFLRRSPSVVQMMWSRESASLDPALCEDSNLDLDPWLLVSFTRLMKDYTPSPFRGGFSMRITDSQSGENGCNYMHRPMKFESDCLAGEGVLFDFISDNCLPASATMLAKQRTLPVASWKHGGDHYVVLRRKGDWDLFCLRLPATGESHLNAFLFLDAACLEERAAQLLNVPHRSSEVRYLVLHLHRHVYRNLCDDEYPQCSAVTCNNYVRHECQRSCGVCDALNPPPSCSFPRRLRGHWYQTDIKGVTRINITENDLIVQDVGHFRCVTFPDSPSRKARMYTTVSLYANGCRPRYTCVTLRRLGPSVLSYTLSRSHVWPHLEHDFGQAICASRQFGMDPRPVHDLYRTQEDTGKPILSDVVDPERVACNLSTSFNITATLHNGTQCHGHLFQHCRDSTRLGITFLHAHCGQLLLLRGETSAALSPSVALSPSAAAETPSPSADYWCLAHFHGHYWERMLMLRSARDARDARCLLLSQLDEGRGLVMVGAQCDKNAWNYARAGLRAPLLSLQLRPDHVPCRDLPPTTTTTTTTPPSPSPSPSAPVTSSRERLESVSLRVVGEQDQPSPLPPLPLPTSFPVVTLPPPLTSPPRLQPKHRISASYEEPGEEERTRADDRADLSPAGKDAASGGVSCCRSPTVVLSTLLALAAGCQWVNRRLGD